METHISFLSPSLPNSYEVDWPFVLFKTSVSTAKCKASNLHMLSPIASLRLEGHAAALVLTGLDLCAMVLGITRQILIYILSLGFVFREHLIVYPWMT